MADVKGKFITLGVRLMSAYPDAQKKANAEVLKQTGRTGDQLEPEGWYPTALFDQVMKLYSGASASKDMAIVTLGRNVYPTIQATVGLPPHLQTPLDFIKFEAEGFLDNHRGAGVVPRKILKSVDREVVIDARAPGYSDKLYEGVYLGILEMLGIRTGKVERTNGSTFRITW